MRHSFRLTIGTFFLLLFWPISSFAIVIVEGNFKARIDDYWSTGLHSDFGFPEIGKEVSVSFSYSVTHNIPGPAPDPNMVTYSGEPNWMSVIYNIDGTEFRVSPHSDYFTTPVLTVQKALPDSEWWDFLDLYSIREEYGFYGGAISTPPDAERLAQIAVWGGVDDTGAIQDFSFTSDDYVRAHLSISSSGYYDSEYFSEALTADIFEFEVRSRAVNVSEPSVLILSCLAFLLLGFYRFHNLNRAYP